MGAVIKCPGCGRSLEPDGTISTGEATLTVYQCEHCIRPWRFDGGVFETMLTFALDADGNLFDPESFEPINVADIHPSAN